MMPAASGQGVRARADHGLMPSRMRHGRGAYIFSQPTDFVGENLI
jgi:hypothetical protein